MKDEDYPQFIIDFITYKMNNIFKNSVVRHIKAQHKVEYNYILELTYFRINILFK